MYVIQVIKGHDHILQFLFNLYVPNAGKKVDISERKSVLIQELTNRRLDACLAIVSNWKPS